jgi:hypothetical protein
LIIKCWEKQQQKQRLNKKSSNVKQAHFIGFTIIKKNKKESYNKNYKKQQIQNRSKFYGINIFEQGINYG